MMRTHIRKDTFETLQTQNIQFKEKIMFIMFSC